MPGAFRACAAFLLLLSSAAVFEARAEDVPSALARVREKSELRWGADAQGGAPYVFLNPRDPNQHLGYEVELAEALAEKLGARASFVQGDYDKLLDLVARGDFEVALNGIEATEEKKRVCELTRSYYVAPERLAVRAGDALAPRSLVALRGRRVATLPSTLAEQILVRAGA
ncbi:transporter substrate-binding domain-containing protein, partial [bacterium]|nr:transporter substrate-binding domain-containing protein [bacterium]